MATRERKPMKSASMIAAAVGVAFVVGSAGGAYAGHKIHAKDIAAGAVHTKQIADRAVIWKKLNANTQDKIKGLAKQGEQGEQGEQGPQGEPGKDGVVGNILHNSHSVDVPAHSNGTEVPVTCAGGDYGDAPNGDAEGYVAVGGGFNVRTRNPGVYVDLNRPLISLNGSYDYNGKGWLVQVNNTTDEVQNVRAWVVCVHAPDDNKDD